MCWTKNLIKLRNSWSFWTSNSDAKEFTFIKFPSRFVWNKKQKQWTPRKRNILVGRIHNISPSAGELFYLKILANIAKDPTSNEELRTVDGTLYPTFKKACYVLGLLEDDQEYIDAIVEESQWGNCLLHANVIYESSCIGKFVKSQSCLVQNVDCAFWRYYLQAKETMGIANQHLNWYILFPILSPLIFLFISYILWEARWLTSKRSFVGNRKVVMHKWKFST